MRFERCSAWGARDLGKHLAGGVLTLALIVSAAPASAEIPASPPTVNASKPWVRWLPGGLPAAAYVTLRNDGDHTATLVGVSSIDYGSAMFHASRNQNGVEKMLALDRIAIAPHAEVRFAPEGLHIMLMQPNRSIAPGEQILLRLQFADGTSLPVRFEVRRPDGSSVSPLPGPTEH
jgi:periplasmic copper chaperone A